MKPELLIASMLFLAIFAPLIVSSILSLLMKLYKYISDILENYQFSKEINLELERKTELILLSKDYKIVKNFTENNLKVLNKKCYKKLLNKIEELSIEEEFNESFKKGIK